MQRINHGIWRLGLFAALLWMIGCGVAPVTPGPDGGPPSVVPEPTTPRTNPPTNPTDPPTNPTDPPTNPTDPPTNPTDPPPNPTEPPDRREPPPDRREPPTDPPTEPSRPDDKPDDPTLFDTGSGPWIGEPCTADSDCSFPSGMCRKAADGFANGYCSRTCTKYCPDRAGKTFTFCADVGAEGGFCWVRCDRTKFPSTGCRAGYVCKWSSRYNQSSVNKEICVPEPSTQPPPRRDPPLTSWIGEPCNQDSDCAFTGGVCLSSSDYTDGHCTQACTRTCPDKSGKPTTFCIDDGNGKGQCVSQCGTTTCRTGYKCETRSRYNEASTSKSVCVPSSSTPPPTRPPSQDKGTYVAKMYITYYYLANEADYSGSATTTLYDSSCKAITKVSASFSDSACIEGSGKLKDGRVINYAKTCSCGRRCPTGGIICYSVLNKASFPWGKGSRNNPLKPFRSLAVDRNIIPIGTKLYIPEWDGVQLPSVDGIGGFVHDGCVQADDVGGAIKGNHFDFFSGTKSMWRALEKIHATKKYLTVYRDPGRCP